jgi:anti-sigma B factor antagonist
MPADGTERSSQVQDSAPTNGRQHDLAIQTESLGVALVMRMKGDIDTASAHALDSRLAAAARIAAPAVPLVVDLTDVAFLDTTGLRVLVEHHQRCAANDTVLAIVAVRRAVLLPMRITTLDRYLRLYPSIATAVARWSA